MGQIEQGGEPLEAQEMWQEALRHQGLALGSMEPVAIDSRWGYEVYDVIPDASVSAHQLKERALQVRTDLAQKRANAVAIVVQPGGAVGPLEVVGDVVFKVSAVYGSGLLIAREALASPRHQESSAGRILPLAPCLGGVAIRRGMHYAYANAGTVPLALLDVSSPPFGPEYERLSGDPHVVGTLRSLGHGARLGPQAP